MATAAIHAHLINITVFDRCPERVPPTGSAQKMVSLWSGSYEGADSLHPTTLDPETLNERSRSNRKTRLQRR